MKFWYKFMTLLLAAVMLFPLAGCKKEESDREAMAAACLEDAQELIVKGKYSEAIELLELGISVTDDQQLKIYLEGIKVMQALQTEPEASETEPTEPEATEPAATQPQTAPEQTQPAATQPPKPAATTQSSPYERYTGYWGGGLLLLELSGSTMTLDVSTAPSAFGRIASFRESFQLSEIKDNTVTLFFYDSWGNSGSAVLTFVGDHLSLYVQNIERDYYAMWSFRDGNTTYYRSYCTGANAYQDDTEEETEPEVTEMDITEPELTEPEESTEVTQQETEQTESD